MSETRNPVKARISPIWLVPALALIIAIGLGYRAWQETGPIIEIVLTQAEGVAVGKTLVKYRNVEIGQVIDVGFTDDYDRVLVKAELDPEIESLISENSQFWLVSPRISLREGFSGLTTLLSGVYLEMDPGPEGGRSASRFEGLTEPPAVRSYEEGTQFELLAETLGSVDIGSPIYHRQVRVGEVTSYRLVPEQNRVQISAFVEAPFDQLVRRQTKFWNVSGFGVELTAEGIEAHMESITSVISGGIAFATPDNEFAGSKLADQGATFSLFPDRDALLEGAYSISVPYLLRFNDTVRGLKLGAPVEYKGLKVGEVTNVNLNYDAEAGHHDLDVYISVQPERIAPELQPDRTELDELFEQLIAEGLRAQLKTGNLLTGALYVDLIPEYRPEEQAELVWEFSHSELPTVESQALQLTRQFTSIVEQIRAVPFKSIGKNLDGALGQARDLLSGINQSYAEGQLGELLYNLTEASDDLESLFIQLEQTAASIDHTVAPDSQLLYEFSDTLERFGDASEAFEVFLEELNRYPNSIIIGKKGE